MSVKINDGDTTVIYPPEPSKTGEPCLDENCIHIGCRVARLEAAQLCPVCTKPLGYGCVQPLIEVADWGFTLGPKPTGKVKLELGHRHLACFIAQETNTESPLAEVQGEN